MQVHGLLDSRTRVSMVHEKLAKAGVHVTESSGIADIQESYGIVLYIEQEDSEKAWGAFK